MTAAGGTWTTEEWTYGGLARGRTAAKVAVWYDTSRARHVFGAEKGRQPLTGGVYEVQVRREDGEIAAIRGPHRYLHRHEDTGWAAELEAAARVEAAHMAAAAQLRSDARQSALDAAMEPLEAIAAKMFLPADREALAMMVTRRIMTARRGN